jgi:hypothetical protein
MFVGTVDERNRITNKNKDITFLPNGFGYEVIIDEVCNSPITCLALHNKNIECNVFKKNNGDKNDKTNSKNKGF